MANDRDSGKLEEKLACSICLDTFATPVTVPCGHSFCVECISKHWDKHEQESAAGQNYSCPECRESFPERPKVSKNVKLDSLVEVFKLREVQVSGAEKLKDVRGRKCPRHARPLELYCRTEKQCICCECSVKECKNHQKVLLEEERKMKEESLKETLQKTQEEAEQITEEIQKLEQQTATIKDSSEKLKSGILQKFTYLSESLKECQRKAMERIESEQATALGHVEQNWAQLREKQAMFSEHNTKAQKLLIHTDDIKFLEELLLLPSPGRLQLPPPLEFDLANNVDAITEFLSEVSRFLQEALSNSLSLPRVAEAKASPEPKVIVMKTGQCLPNNELRRRLLKGMKFPKFPLLYEMIG